MTYKNTIILDFNATNSNRIKHLAIHPKKEWIGIINSNNTYSLWNYKEKILIKSFSCTSLDDTKVLDVRESLFYDRYCLPIRSPNSQIRNNIIFATAQKIYFYDYLTDVIKMISEKELEQKTIKKVAIYSDTKICIVINDGSFKVLDIRGLYSKDTQPEATIRTFRGYHSKPIEWIFSYTQNTNEMPRVITVSASDGLMACWNVDSMLLTGQSSEISTPCFKFIMNRGNKNDSNNGEEILSLQYDSSSYHLVTLTQSYLTIWSTMIGTEIKRVKNNLKLKQVIFFNHFSYGQWCLLGYSSGSSMLVIKCKQQLQYLQEINLKEYVKSPELSIIRIKSIAERPSNLFIITTTDLIILEVDKFYQQPFGCHPGFITKLTSFNTKNFILKNEGQIKPSIPLSQVYKIDYPNDILISTFYLSFDYPWIYFNLIEIQYKSMQNYYKSRQMLHDKYQYKKHKVLGNSLFGTNLPQTTINVSYDGTSIILFNKHICYYEVYTLHSNQNDLIGNESVDIIDFYTPLKLVHSGFARNIVWHQFKHQFGAFCGLDKNGQLVTYTTEKQKKGIFSKSKSNSPKLSGEVATWHVCIFNGINNQQQYTRVVTTPPIKTKLFSLFNMGQQYGYSYDKVEGECLDYISTQSTNKQIQGIISVPEKFYISYCQTYQIYGYDGYFIIYRVLQNGLLSYFRSMQYTIIDGYFWQKLFFFITTQENAILIRIAHWSPPLYNIDNKIFEGFKNEDLQPYCYAMPDGHLQIMNIINMNLMVVNITHNITLLDLRVFPYVQFCMEVSSGFYDRAGVLYNNSSAQIQMIMKQTLSHYGLILSDIMI